MVCAEAVRVRSVRLSQSLGSVHEKGTVSEDNFVPAATLFRHFVLFSLMGGHEVMGYVLF